MEIRLTGRESIGAKCNETLDAVRDGSVLNVRPFGHFLQLLQLPQVSDTKIII